MKNRKLIAFIISAFVMVLALSFAFAANTVNVPLFAEEATASDTTTTGSDTTTTGATDTTTTGSNTETPTPTPEPTGFRKFMANKTVQIVVMVLVYGGLFALLYFVLIRPQQKKRKQEEQMRSSLMLGDTVTTIGGIVGRVVKIQDDDITIETSLDRSLITFKNWAIRDIKHFESDDEKDEGKKDSDK